MAFCPAPRDQGMVTAVTETVDCHIRVLVHDTYLSLVGPNTWFAAAFTGLLTIYIALVGYQLLLGRGGLRLTEMPFIVLKLGLILAFLTSWAAYQTLIFNFLFDGPSDILKVLLGPLAAQGSGFDGDVLGGIQRAYTDLSDAAGVYGGMATPNANLLQGGPMLGSGLLWFTAIALLLGTLGLIVAAKIVLAFLLAIGPIFIGMALFSVTRGFFDGWLRTTVAFALTPLAVAVFGAAMLMILQPFLDILIENAQRRLFDMGPVITIGLIVAVFCIVMLMGLGAVAGLARGYSSGRGGGGPFYPRLPAPEMGAGAPAGPRAEEIAARIAATDRMREVTATASISSPGGAYSGDRRVGEASDAVWSPPSSEGRLGQAYNRAPRPVIRRDGDG
jgi:type IV secretion system protein VirB6